MAVQTAQPACSGFPAAFLTSHQAIGSSVPAKPRPGSCASGSPAPLSPAGSDHSRATGTQAIAADSLALCHSRVEPSAGRRRLSSLPAYHPALHGMACGTGTQGGTGSQACLHFRRSSRTHSGPSTEARRLSSGRRPLPRSVCKAGTPNTHVLADFPAVSPQPARPHHRQRHHPAATTCPA